MKNERAPLVQRAISDPDLSEDLYAVLHRSAGGKSSLGLRDSHKIEKLQRISAAARKLFIERGYEGTTLREIANEARVALGTLGFYAEDKRDLILLIFNQDIPELIEAGRSRIRKSDSDIASLVNMFQPFYLRYASEPTLYKILLRDNLFQRNSVHAREFLRLRMKIVSIIRNILVDTGIKQPEDTLDLAAKGLFFIYFAQVRWWISGEAPKARTGLKELELLFKTHLTGIHGGASS